MHQLSNDALHQRGLALEDEFFRRVDQKLIAQLRAQADFDAKRESLVRCTGLQDSPLIDALMEHDITPASVSALMLLPAVLVAWADGSVSVDERQAVLHEAIGGEVSQSPNAMELLEHWLHQQPDGSLWRLWQEYAGAVYDQVGPEKAGELADRVLALATRVANTSGGILGRRKISAAEQLMLDEIADHR